jgi:NAD(P)-dependent dehydrogenase (short-subunit alcohol dehydrogenase family)
MVSTSSIRKVAVVTGASSGLGREISLTLARNGFTTYATMRNLQKGNDIRSVAEKENLPVKIAMLDVTEDRSVTDAVKSIIAEANRIDVLVNNAGYGLVGAFEDLAMEEIKSQYETNLFGVIRVTQAIIPVMRKQKSGTIINISSGVVTLGGQLGGSAYASTKFAVEGLRIGTIWNKSGSDRAWSY